jgi:hypothetical protein
MHAGAAKGGAGQRGEVWSATQNNKRVVTVAVIAHVACCGVFCRYGSDTPDMDSLFLLAGLPASLSWSAVYTPYITDYNPVTPCPTTGFCLDPTTFVLNTDPVSV